MEGWHGWDDYTPFYDWENARTVGRRDIRFWQRLAERCGGPVLELGCGTGRVSVPVARTVTSVVGIDRSDPMLRQALRRHRRSRAAGRLHFVRGDVRSLPLRGSSRFRLVMAPYGVLQSLLRDRDLRDTLRSVLAVLRHGGTFAIDIVPDLPRWREYDRRVSLRGRRRGGATRIQPHRVGQAGSTQTADDLRPGVRRATRPHANHAPVIRWCSAPCRYGR